MSVDFHHPSNNWRYNTWDVFAFPARQTSGSPSRIRCIRNYGARRRARASAAEDRAECAECNGSTDIPRSSWTALDGRMPTEFELTFFSRATPVTRYFVPCKGWSSTCRLVHETE